MQTSPQVAVIVVSYNTRELLLECLSSIIQSTTKAVLEIVVVDNASSDDSVAAAREKFPKIKTLVNETNLGFSVACNQAIRATTAPLILLLNSDALLTAGAFASLSDMMAGDPRCGAAGCRVVNSANTEAVSTRNFLTPFNQALELLGVTDQLNSRYLKRSYQPSLDDNQIDCHVDWIDGSCLMVRRLALDKVGLFDERFFMYSEDEDLCLRLRDGGWKVCYSANGKAIHHGGASSLQNRTEMLRQFYRSQILFLNKHRGAASTWIYFWFMRLALLLKRVGHSWFSRNNDRAQSAAEHELAITRAWSGKAIHEHTRNG